MWIIRRILALIISRKVLITAPNAKHIDDIVCRARFSDDCLVRANWCDMQIILKPDGNVKGLPTTWQAKWKLYGL